MPAQSSPISSHSHTMAILFSAALLGAISGYVQALFAVQLEQSGVPTRLIGAANTGQMLAIPLLAAVLPRILYRANLYKLHLTVTTVGLTAMLALALTMDTIWLHIPLRFVLGCGIASGYVIYEYWLNSTVSDQHRGKIMALYGTAVVAGMGMGPLLVPIVNDFANLPFLAGALLFMARMVPVRLVRHRAPRIHDAPPSANLMAIIRLSPTVAMTGLMFGITESAMFGFMPIYGLREGLSETHAVFLLTCIFWGGLALQLPVGWLADHINTRSVLLTATGIGAIGGIILPYLIGDAGWPLWAHMLFWGGVVTTIYTIATILLGREHKEANLANATLAFVMMYGIGSIIGPLITGEALERIGTQGLPWVMGLACAVTFVFTAWRTIKGHHQ